MNSKLANLTAQLCAETRRQSRNPDLLQLVDHVEKELKREHKREMDLLKLQRLQRALLEAGLPLSRDPVEWLHERGPQLKRLQVEEEAASARELQDNFAR